MADPLQFKTVIGLAASPLDERWVYNVSRYPPITPAFKFKYRAYKYDPTIEYILQQAVELGIFDTQVLAVAACEQDYNALLAIAGVPVPSLSSVAPSTAPANATVLVTVNGGNFDVGVMVQVTLADGVTTDDIAPYNAPSGTTFQVQIPWNDIAKPGTIELAILNGDGKLSNQLPFTVTAQGPPVLSAMTPSAGLPNQNVTVNLSGNGFDTGAVVLVGATVVQPSIRSANSGLTFVMSASLIPTAGPYNVLVGNSDGQKSAALIFTAQSVPVLSTMSPSQAPYGAAVEITLTGTGFDPGAVVFVGSTVVQPDSRTGQTGLTFQMTAALIPITGQYPVSVQNSDGGTTGQLIFTAQSKPVLSTMTPNTAVHGTVVSVTLTGTGFSAGAQVFFGSVIVVPDTRTGTTGLTFTVTAAMMPNTGSYAVTVQNNDGGTSNALSFTAT